MSSKTQSQPAPFKDVRTQIRVPHNAKGKVVSPPRRPEPLVDASLARTGAVEAAPLEQAHRKFPETTANPNVDAGILGKSAQTLITHSRCGATCCQP